MTQSVRTLFIAIIIIQNVISHEMSGVLQDAVSSPFQSAVRFEYQNKIQIEQKQNNQLTVRILQKSGGCPNNCNNHGICDNSNNTCICNINWTGVDCLTYEQPEICEECCSKVSCIRGRYDNNSCGCKKCKEKVACCGGSQSCYQGSCATGSCVCFSGYYRADCSEQCPHVCKNGKCVNAKCNCLTGWDGPDCSIKLCLDNYQNYRQNICKVGWSGTGCCEIKCLNDCSGSGTCIKGTCVCTNDRYGSACQYSKLQDQCQGQWINEQCVCSGKQYGPNCLICDSCSPSNRHLPYDGEISSEDDSDPNLAEKIVMYIFFIVGVVGLIYSCYLLICMRKCRKKQNNNVENTDNNNNLESQQQNDQNLQNNQPVLQHTNNVLLLDQIVYAAQNKPHTNPNNNTIADQQVIKTSLNHRKNKNDKSNVPQQAIQVRQEAIKNNYNVRRQEADQTKQQILNYHSILQFKQNQKKYQMTDQNIIKNKSQCSICLDDINTNTEFKINCPSKHIFHKKCIDQWLLKHQTCPQCRGQISSE